MSQTSLMEVYRGLTSLDAKELDSKRENANIDGNTSMGLMLKFGSEGSIEFAKLMLLRPEHVKAHEDRHIHIHDLDFLSIGTTTCCQIDLHELFGRSFSTGYGSIRPPNDISTFASLACIVLQSNQNEQHGGQSIPAFDYAMAEGVRRTYVKDVVEKVGDLLLLRHGVRDGRACVGRAVAAHGDAVGYKRGGVAALLGDLRAVAPKVTARELRLVEKVVSRSVENKTFQAMEALIHNLNTMHSRAGSQVPFTSLNFGTDTTPEGRLASRMFLRATWNGLGKGETAIFPISVFKVKEGVNYNAGDPNFDLFQLAIKVSAKRLFPNFVFLDAPFNLKYYKAGDYRTEAVAMGCRTRVMASVFPESDGVVTGRGNLSFTTVNLVRIGIEHGVCQGARGAADMAGFYGELDRTLGLVVDQLLERFALQCSKRRRNFPFMLGQGIWFGSKDLGDDDDLREVLKHGTLSIGFIGLAECLVALTGKHHGESDAAWALGKEIVGRMRAFCDRMCDVHRLNFSLLGTPAEGLSGRFVRYDAEKYGKIAGVTDREYYTNSFHVPVYFPISAAEKIRREAPFHALCNAGHITYVEMDGDPSKNLKAFEHVVRMMKENNIGYGSINHPVDRDPVCGFSGIINEECPQCHRHETEDQRFERLRRITGYLVGSLERWNNAKQAEERDRVKHC